LMNQAVIYGHNFLRLITSYNIAFMALN
jgi:hypothetical protein